MSGQPPASRRICAFTGSRADYGPMSPLLQRLRNEPQIELRILASGSHLRADRGLTINSIREDGFSITESVDINLAADDPTSVCKSVGLACIGLTDVVSRIRPELVIVAGDRYECLAMAVVAAQHLIPIVHLGGGALTYGSIDDRMRHAISKLSSVHFVGSAIERTRLIRMGEQADRVFEIPYLGADSSILSSPTCKEELESFLQRTIRYPTFVVTVHPETANPAATKRIIDAVLESLDEFPDAVVVLTAPNTDAQGKQIEREAMRWVSNNQERAVFVPSLGRRKYLSLMHHSTLVLGNSSSGLIEAPILGTPTVNVGSRQDGRERAASVVDCAGDSRSVTGAIHEALRLKRTGTPISDCLVAADQGVQKMVDILRSIDVEELKTKVFPNDCYAV